MKDTSDIFDIKLSGTKTIKRSKFCCILWSILITRYFAIVNFSLSKLTLIGRSCVASTSISISIGWYSRSTRTAQAIQSFLRLQTYDHSTSYKYNPVGGSVGSFSGEQCLVRKNN
uniref:Uncharacterized protein n=1 Tax=Glossina pallidipes TaxID=7398 RepID=A0A1A9Z4M6_GLOPL